MSYHNYALGFEDFLRCGISRGGARSQGIRYAGRDRRLILPSHTAQAHERRLIARGLLFERFMSLERAQSPILTSTSVKAR